MERVKFKAKPLPELGKVIGWEMSPAVKDKTLSRLIGMVDGNKYEIFEHDIVKYKDELSVVFYSVSGCKFIMVFKDKEVGFENISTKDLEVVGNIFDNPEMIDDDDWKYMINRASLIYGGEIK